MLRFSVPLLFALALLAGCGPSTETRQYRITVRNTSTEPVTVWLTKNGPPFEELWASPEDLAHPAMGLAEKEGAVLEPGDIGTIPGTPDGYFTGKFNPGTNAVLRVYSGRRTFDEMLAASRDAGTRNAFILPPGESEVTVTKGFPVTATVNMVQE